MTTNKVHSSPTYYYGSPNDIGYVGLPREAVLDNTASPDEQRVFAEFAKIAAIPPAIVAAYFAPPVAIIGAAFLASCGDPGEAGDPTLALALNAELGEVASDGGTTDEGDAFVTADGGRTRSGDALVAADDGGMSTPDDGMTLVDADQDGGTSEVAGGNDADAETLSNDGGMSESDDGMTLVDAEMDATPGDSPDAIEGGATDAASPVEDADALIAGDDGGTSIPDDGMTLVDAEMDATPGDSPDAIEDGATDAASPVEDADVLIAGDDGGTSIPDDGMTLVDADSDGKTDTGFDGTKDTAPPCPPSCKPVAGTVECIEGSTNVPAFYLVKCATKFVCDEGFGIAKISVNLPNPAIETKQPITVDECVKGALFGACYVVNGDLSDYCMPMEIDAKPKPNPAPTVSQVDPKNPALPSGDHLYIKGNTIAITATAEDVNGDPTKCTAAMKTPKGQPLVSITDALTPNKIHTLQLPAEFFGPFGKYPGSVTCMDDKGAVSPAFDFVLLTTDASATLFMTADEGSGNTVQDWGGKGNKGDVKNWVNWIGGVNGSAIQLGIGSVVDFAPNTGNFGKGPFTMAAWVYLEGASSSRAIIEHRTKTHGYEFALDPLNQLVFYSYGSGCAFSGGVVGAKQWHHVAVTREANAITLYVDGKPVKSGVCANDLTNEELFRIGCNTPSIICQEPLNGAVDEVAIALRALSGAEILAQCKLYDPAGVTCVGP